MDWQRPKTTKLYLHPPFAERVVTVWPDCKVINGSIRERDPLNRAKGFGFLLLYGDGLELLPWREAVFTVRDDGIPVHRVSYRGAIFTLSLECFCSMDRSPATFCRIGVRNEHPWAIRSSVTLVPRDGQETYLMCASVDAYQSYEPSAESWGMLPSAWVYGDGRISCGEGTIVLGRGCGAAAGISCTWLHSAIEKPFLHQKVLKIDFALDAGGETSLDLAMFRGGGREFDFEAERAKTVRAWQAELGKITRHPDTDISRYRSMFSSLVAQCLQMFAVYEGTDDVFPRQGALVHWIWPWEAAEMLTALDRIGLHEHTEKVFEFYRRRLQVREGPDRGMIRTIGIDWACQTGSVLFSLSYHLIAMHDRERFDHYRQMLLDGFAWIERTRGSTGLFPPMKASDWPDECQSWCWTDLNTLMGLEEMHRLFVAFRDADADRIGTSAAGYRQLLEGILAKFADEQKDGEEILIPNKLGKPLTDPPLYPYHAEAGNLVRLRLITPGSRIFRQLEAYYRNRRLMRNGLVGLMQDSPPGDRWCGHTWYLGISELAWFSAWLETGEFAKAEEAFLGLTTYGMTAEFYMQERYADNDPTYVPWSPNASNNGRTIKMMLDYFEYRRTGKIGREP